MEKEEDANNITTESKEISKDDILNFIHDHKIAINNDNPTLQDSTLDNSKQEVIVNLSEDEQQVLFNTTEVDDSLDDVRYVIQAQEPERLFKQEQSEEFSAIVVTDLEKDLFLRAILKSEPFRLQLLRANVLSLEAETLQAHIKHTINVAVLKHDLTDYERSMLLMGCMLKKLNDKDIKFKNDLEPVLAFLNEKKDWFKLKTEEEQNFIFLALDLFLCKVEKLKGALNDQNFWIPQD